MTRRAAAALLFGSLAAAALLLARGSRDGARSPVDVSVFEVQPGRFARLVTAEGTLKATKATPLATPLDVPEAVKIAYLAPDGSFVKKGDVLVRFDPTDFVNRLREGSEENSTAGNKLAKAEAQAAASRENLRRDADQAGRELEASRSFQKKDEEIFSRSQIIESEIDEKLAAHKLQHARTVQQVRDRLARAERELIAIEQRKAKLKIRQAERGLGALEVPAPHDGILVLKRDWRGEIPRVGDTSWSGEPLGEIPDLSSMQAEVFVLEADAGGLAPGQRAKIVVESNPGVEHPARVARVEPIAKPRRRNVPVQYFGATLELPGTPSPEMKPGARVRATLVIEERAGVLAVPLHSVFEKDGRKVVYRLGKAGFEAAPVTLGGSSLGRVVVARGLSAGDRVALTDPTKPASRRREGKPRIGWPATGGVRP